MEEHVTQIINNCILCLQKSNMASVTQTILQHRELLSYPLQRICLDTVGPLTSSRFQGKPCKYLLIILDGVTGYLKAIPIPDLEAKPLLKAFMEGFVLVHGVPEVVHTDNGSIVWWENYSRIPRTKWEFKPLEPQYTHPKEIGWKGLIDP